MFSKAWFFFLCYISLSQAYVFSDEECLNYTVYPVQYDITLKPHIYLDGTAYYHCDIIISIIANAPNVNIIELDYTDTIKSVEVMNGDRDIVNQNNPYKYDKDRRKLYIYLNENLEQYSVSKRQYLIKITFSRSLNDGETSKFFVPYDGEDRRRYIVNTRFSPDRAKFFFPCFDNTRFEAVFKFRVHIAPHSSGRQYTDTSLVIATEQRRHGNEAENVIIEYLPSPQVALHEVGFHYSQYKSRQVTAKYTNDTLVIWAPTPDLQYYDYILQFGRSLINLIHEYASINRPLVNGPINIVGVPYILDGYEIGSWNLLSNNKIRLENRYQYTSIKQIEKMKFELAQQLSRIWLGNPGESQRTRWTEEWFKEGVATYFAFYFLTQFGHGNTYTNQRFPIEYYGIKMRNKAMAIDTPGQLYMPALVSYNRSLAIEIPQLDRELVTMKTASILWMVENWLGSDKFHRALVNYINTRRGKTISLADFLLILDYETIECEEQFTKDFTGSKVLNSWFHRSGYPVVNVKVFRDRTPNVVLLEQRQFSFLEKHRLNSDFLIPISYIVQDNQNCFNCFQTRFTIGGLPYTFNENLNGGWIILNRNASGYYRVNYDELTWNLIAKTLKENHLAINELNRAQIVNDIFALYAANNISIEIAMDVLDYLNKEISYVVWDSAIDGFELLKYDRLRMTKKLYEELQNFMQHKISVVYKRLNEIEQHARTRLFRSRMMEFACALGYKPCLVDMERLYRYHGDDLKTINPDFREAYFYVVGSRRTTDFKMMNEFEQEDEKIAVHRKRIDKSFYNGLSLGTPRPQPMTRTTFATTEMPLVVTQSAVAGSSTIDSASVLLITVLSFYNIVRVNL